jgi:hypothetical protein
MDILGVNKSPFFFTISQWVEFSTAVAAIKNGTKNTLLIEARAILNLYESRGLNISRAKADQKFSCITEDLLPISVNVANADDQVAEVERSIRTVKERMRCTVQGLLFWRIPKLTIRAVVEGAHKALNQFPARDGVSDAMSSLTMMTGRPAPDYHNLKIEFGTYAHVFEGNGPTNTNRTRSTEAIPLNAAGNAQGGYFLLLLTTGRRILRQQWTGLPMLNGVIAAVEAVAAAEQQSIMGNSGPVFEWSPGISIVDEDEPPLIVDDLEEDVHKDVVIEDDGKEEAQEENIIEDDNVEQDNIGAVEAAADDALEGEDPVPEEPGQAFLLHNNVEEARSDDGDGDSEVDDNNGMAEDPMAMEEDEPESTSHQV